MVRIRVRIRVRVTNPNPNPSDSDPNSNHDHHQGTSHPYPLTEKQMAMVCVDGIRLVVKMHVNAGSRLELESGSGLVSGLG